MSSYLLKTGATLILVITIIYFWSMPSAADWSHDTLVNTPICMEANFQSDHRAVIDGEGGIVVAWGRPLITPWAHGPPEWVRSSEQGERAVPLREEEDYSQVPPGWDGWAPA